MPRIADPDQVADRPRPPAGRPTADLERAARPKDALPVTPGAALGLQGFQGQADRRFDPAKVHPVRNDPDALHVYGVGGDLVPKPVGGLWTSTVTNRGERFASEWTDLATTKGYISSSNSMWVLRPDPDARIYRIDSHADLQELCRRYPASAHHVDWEQVAVDFDAVHLTDHGVTATRSGWPNLSTWEVECTVWFRPRLTVAQQGQVAEPAGLELEDDAG